MALELVALALALPLGFAHRDEVMAMTYGVGLLPLVLQGLTMPWMIRRLKVGGSADFQVQMREAESAAAPSALAMRNCSAMGEGGDGAKTGRKQGHSLSNQPVRRGAW